MYGMYSKQEKLFIKLTTLMVRFYPNFGKIGSNPTLKIVLRKR